MCKKVSVFEKINQHFVMFSCFLPISLCKVFCFSDLNKNCSLCGITSEVQKFTSPLFE